MLNPKFAIIGIITILMVVPVISESDAELWDLIIIADIENGPILQGQSPIITGVVVDHASKPVDLAQVHIRSGQGSIFTVTDEHGQFRVVLENFNKIPGTYIVNIVGNAPDGKTGIASIEFQVKGDLSPESILEEQLSTPEAIRYLQAQQEDFAKDPIGFTLWNHYQKLNQEYIEKKIISEQLTEEEIFIEQQKAIAEELRQQAIEEFNPSYGVFSGYKYEDYVKSLDPEIKDTVASQLNFTKNLFEEAQLLKQEVLNNGGTQEEAMNAYFEKLSVSKNALENFGYETIEIQNNTDTETIQNKEETTEEIQEESKDEIENESVETNLDGTNVKVDFDGKKIFVNVNGTTIEFIVNSTGVYQVE
ncbi:carboxypeptidase regulatory-like domain-containing protein [Nitrosopumilus sp. K4]|uniref:carboxypeptidase-like regulatory domain-containing protein n=1 Tax=Nitrosopumilus sp. K4 TaxID=2795383 RepID=UPI001BACF165|nr:carboxypeptidase-like regulatory domain-containing protein [Nitrosopumilus sp. K4]QUC65296.1 carboxypeptidase regulatory-like domain-containing protein [Nitrosopumilus sp. K4]